MNKMKAAWAIETRYVDIDGTDRNGFIGASWFTYPLPVCMSGNRTALFTTRQAARQHLPAVKASFTRARVVKVELTITIVGVG
jgi:hypothetical protein